MDALVIAGCLSGEEGDAGVAALVRELAAAVDASVMMRARTGGRPMGVSLPEALADLRARGARRALVATTHVVDGRLQREAAAAVRAAAPGFEKIRLARPLLACEEGCADEAIAMSAMLSVEKVFQAITPRERASERAQRIARRQKRLSSELGDHFTFLNV